MPGSLNQRRDWLVGLLIFAPIFIAAAIAVFRYPLPLQGDMALQILKAQDVGSHTPLLGAYSRYGWSHPGPALSFLLSIPAKVFSNPSLAVSLFALLIKWIPLSASFVLVKQTFNRNIAFLFGAFTYVFLFYHREGVGTIWNPTVGLSLFIFLIVITITRPKKIWMLPVALIIASLLIQFHVGFVIPTIALVVIITSQSISVIKSSIGSRTLLACTSLGATGVGLIWLPPFLDQINGSRNVSHLFQFFTSSTENEGQKVGIAGAIRILSHQLLPISAWNGEPDMEIMTMESKTFSALWLTALICISIVTLAYLRRNKSPFSGALGIVLFMIGVSILTVAQASRPSIPYLFGWVAPIAMLFWFVVSTLVFSVLHSVKLLSGRRVNAYVLSLCMSVIIFSVAMPQQTPKHLFEMESTKRLSAIAEEFLKDEGHVGILHTEPFAGIGFGLTMELERIGKTVLVEPLPGEIPRHRERMWGKHRVNGEVPDLTIAAARGAIISEMLLSPENWQLIDTYDPMNLASTNSFDAQTPEQVVALLVRDNR